MIIIFIFLLFKLEAAEFLDAPFERIVSLGSMCQTRFQINQHLKEAFHSSDKELHDLWGGSQLFDWTAVYDYEKLNVLLLNNLEGLFARENLQLTNHWCAKSKHVENIFYSIGFNHLFMRTSPTEIDIDGQYANISEKVLYLKNKFLDLKNFKTLYVILRHEVPAIPVCFSIKESLIKIRGNDNFSLLVVSLNRQELPLPIDNIFFDNVIPHPTGDWRGNRESWKKVFDKFSFKPKEEQSKILLLDTSLY